MMVKKKSNSWARAKYAFVLPLAAVAVVAFARPEIAVPLERISTAKVSNLSVMPETIADKNEKSDLTVRMQVVDETNQPISGATVIVAGTERGVVTDKEGWFTLSPLSATDRLHLSYVGKKSLLVPVSTLVDKSGKTLQMETEVVHAPEQPEQASDKRPDDQIFRVVEQMPSFPGGMSACFRFLSENVRYPADAHQAQVEGRVIVQFVVEKDGSISQPTIVRSVYPSIDAEVLRLISSMPKWEPGRQRGEAVAVKYTIPVGFWLDGEKPSNQFTLDASEPTKAPLILIDGVERKNFDLSTFPVDSIQQISVLKDKEAIQRYQTKGKNGVILITTKRK